MYRVLFGYGVREERMVGSVDNGVWSGALAAAGGAGDQDERARLAGELRHRGRQPEGLELRRLVGDHAECPAHRALLEVEVAAEAAHPLDSEREVELALLLEFLLLGLREEAVGQVLGVGRAERRMGQGEQPAVQADHRWAVRGEMEVRRPPLDHLAQEGLDGWHGARESRGRATCYPSAGRTVRLLGPSALCQGVTDAKRGWNKIVRGNRPETVSRVGIGSERVAFGGSCERRAAAGEAGAAKLKTLGLCVRRAVDSSSPAPRSAPASLPLRPLPAAARRP